MSSFHWQKQNMDLWKVVWAVSAIIASLAVIILLSFGYGIEVAGGSFLVLFLILRVMLAYIFKNRYANSMVRIMKLDYEDIERDFRFVFKEKHINYKQKFEEDSYSYEFPWRRLNMRVQPHWLSPDRKPVTRVTLYELNPKNREFAEMLADSLDEMESQLLAKQIDAP